MKLSQMVNNNENLVKEEVSIQQPLQSENKSAGLTLDMDISNFNKSSNTSNNTFDAETQAEIDAIKAIAGI